MALWLNLFVLLLLLLEASSNDASCPSIHICFAVDKTSETNLIHSLQKANFLISLIRRFNRDSPNSKFSGVSYSSSNEIIHADFNDIRSFFHSTIGKDDTTRISPYESGLVGCLDNFGNSTIDNRMVIFFSSKNNNYQQSFSETAKILGVTIYTVGIGTDDDMEKMSKMASSLELTAHARNVARLISKVPWIVRQTCNYFKKMLESVPSLSTTTYNVIFTMSPSASYSHVLLTPSPSNPPSISNDIFPSLPTLSEISDRLSLSLSPSPSQTKTAIAATPSVSLSPFPGCALVECEQCDDGLYCFSKSNNATLDMETCTTVTDKSKFCNNNNQTACGQSCNNSLDNFGVLCFQNNSWPECPPVIGSRCPMTAEMELPSQFPTVSSITTHAICTKESNIEMSCISNSSISCIPDSN